MGRFGSKEQLQLATLDEAADIFRHTVYEPASTAPPGLARLNAICDAWVAYLARPPFPGGCFLTTAMVEFDARPGPVNNAVKKVMRRWLALLEREASTAISNGELPADTDPRRWRSRSTRWQSEPTATSNSTATQPPSSAPGEQ